MKAQTMLLAAAAAILAGCATLQAEAKDDALVEAGFTKVRTADWMATLKTMPANRFLRRTVNGVPMYFYGDPISCRCVYQGSEQAYSQYRRMQVQENLMRREMEADDWE